MQSAVRCSSAAPVDFGFLRHPRRGVSAGCQPAIIRQGEGEKEMKLSGSRERSVAGAPLCIQNEAVRG